MLPALAAELGELAAAAAAKAPITRAPYPLVKDTDVTIVVVSDEQFLSSYALHLQTMKCYAARHKYKFFALNPIRDSPSCQLNHKEFFFRKHCAIRQYLSKLPESATLVVLDGDVIAGASDQSLDLWLNSSAFDIALYERTWNFEIAAGNYIVRNTRFARRFLQLWANYESLIPPGEFLCCVCVLCVCVC